MIDPEIWGPHYWGFLHTIAFCYPNYPTTITKKYQPTINCEGISQSVKIIEMDKEYLRSFDEANVRFKFMYKPEVVEAGSLFLFREGLTKGIGKIINVY